VLLCRRGVYPGYGQWSLPAGFIEVGETGARGALREALEEANVAVAVERPYALFHIAHVNQVHVVYLARLLDGHFRAGSETLEARLFAEEEVPWSELAFATTRDALRQYFVDYRSGDFGFHFADVVPFEPWAGAALGPGAPQ